MDMKLTSINCPNCNGQLREENGKFICMSCGGAFAIDYDEADVEHEKLQTEAERERIRIEREKELMETKIRLEEEAQMRRAERTRKAATSGILKFFLIPICIMLVMSIGSMIFFSIIGKRVSKRATNWMTNSSKTTTTAQPQPAAPSLNKEAILADRAFIENALASGSSLVKTRHSKPVQDWDLKTELNSDELPIGQLDGEPRLENVYFIENEWGNSFVMIYALDFTYQDGIDAKKTMYYGTYLSDISLGAGGKIVSDYRVQYEYGASIVLIYEAYADKNQLYREAVLGKGGTVTDLTNDLVDA